MGPAEVLGMVSAQHTARDFTGFLAEIDRQVQPDLAVHLIWRST